ncbi:MAG: thiamine phosphate synthase [Solirubrobacterales bacterium]
MATTTRLSTRAQRVRRLADARLYFVCEARPPAAPLDAMLAGALRGGADLIQLRDTTGDDDVIRAAAPAFRRAADEHGALFLLNDRPGLALELEADGVHVGQDDVSVAEARDVMGPDALVGLSTHAPAELAAGRGADYLSVGPVWETPTKAGRPATGLDYVRHAATTAPGPFFAIGGIDETTIHQVVQAGARRAVVVRAIRDARDPEAVAARLRATLTERD